MKKNNNDDLKKFSDDDILHKLVIAFVFLIYVAIFLKIMYI